MENWYMQWSLQYVPKVDKTAKLATCTPDDFERFNVSFRVLKSRAFPEGCPTEISEFHRGAAISVLETITSNLKLILNTQTQNLAEGIKSSARRMLSMSISSTILSWMQRMRPTVMLFMAWTQETGVMRFISTSIFSPRTLLKSCSTQSEIRQLPTKTFFIHHHRQRPQYRTHKYLWNGSCR